MVNSDEPTELDNDLEERLLSLRNMIDLTLLALSGDRHELIPTGLEESFCKMQKLLDDYCIKKKDIGDWSGNSRK